MKRIIIKLIKTYQFLVSPLFANNCRYYPTCSQYMINHIKQDGLFKGCLKGILRVLRCNTLFQGGIDY